LPVHLYIGPSPISPERHGHPGTPAVNGSSGCWHPTHHRSLDSQRPVFFKVPVEEVCSIKSQHLTQHTSLPSGELRVWRSPRMADVINSPPEESSLLGSLGQCPDTSSVSSAPSEVFSNASIFRPRSGPLLPLALRPSCVPSLRPSRPSPPRPQSSVVRT